MPRKNKTPALKIRLRDNQRRSRARQKEFIEDLQRRLQAYEQHGVQATLDMQRAARSVAQENSRMRALLVQHGVSHDEIENFIRFGEEGPDGDQRSINGPASDGPLPTPEHCSRSTGARSLSPWGVDIQEALPWHQPCTRSSTKITPPSGESAMYTSNSSDHVNNTRQPNGRDSDKRNVPIGHSPSEPVSTSAQLKPPLLAPAQVVLIETSPVASPMETLCDAAAAIIADVQGHSDRRVAYAAMGCQGFENCTVKNTKIFDLLEKPS